MMLRPRIVDTLAVLGLLLLLVFTPAYLAQDPAERDLAEGVDFHFPAPRIGDRATLELVLEWGDDEPVVLPNVRTIEVRAVEPGEVPVHALYVIEETRRPLHVAFPWGDLSVDAASWRNYYDAEGRAVWLDRDMVLPPDEDGSDGDAAAVKRQWSTPITDGYSDLNHHAVAPVVYHPSDLALIRREAAANVPTFFAAVQGQHIRDGTGHLEMSAQVLRQRGAHHFLLGHDPYERLMGSEWAGFDYRGVHTFAHGFTFHGDVEEDLVAYAGGQFANEQWFMPIGGWQWFEDSANDTRLDVWSFPTTMERGEGDPLPVNPLYNFAPRSYARPAATTPDLPTITMGELPEQDHEWLRGLTLPELVNLLTSDDAVTEVRAAAEGRLVAFAWQAGSSQTVLDQADDERLPVSPVPLPVGQPADPATATTTYHDVWTAAFLGTAGTVRVVNATIETDARGHRLVASADLCNGYVPKWMGLDRVDCQPVPEALSALSRPIVDPVAALQRIQEHEASAVLPDTFSFQPLGRYETRAFSLFDGSAFGDWLAPFGFWADVPNSGARYAADDHMPTGIINWRMLPRDGAASGGSLWGDTGQLAIQHRFEAQNDEAGLASGTAPLTPTAAGAASPEVLQVRSAEAITGSLFLLALWATIRGIFVAKSGAWVPLYAFLYAKIAKDHVLDNERRDAIVSLLDADPGLTTTEIGKRLDMGWGATVHHLETLRRNGLLSMVRHGHRHHYFRSGALPETERLRFVYSRDPIYGPFLRTVDTHPGAPLKDIAQQVRQGKAGASRTGKRLVELGLLRRERQGREVRFFPAT